jgi:hypothetical protein
VLIKKQFVLMKCIKIISETAQLSRTYSTIVGDSSSGFNTFEFNSGSAGLVKIKI